MYTKPVCVLNNVTWGVLFIYLFFKLGKLLTTKQSSFDKSSTVLVPTMKLAIMKLASRSNFKGKNITIKINCYHLLSFHEFWQFSVPTDNFPVEKKNK